jgi:hypothetical protein
MAKKVSKKSKKNSSVKKVAEKKVVAKTDEKMETTPVVKRPSAKVGKKEVVPATAAPAPVEATKKVAKRKAAAKRIAASAKSKPTAERNARVTLVDDSVKKALEIGVKNCCGMLGTKNGGYYAEITGKGGSSVNIWVAQPRNLKAHALRTNAPLQSDAGRIKKSKHRHTLCQQLPNKALGEPAEIVTHINALIAFARTGSSKKAVSQKTVAKKRVAAKK